MQIADHILKICDPSTGEIIAVHTISQEKRRLIKNRNHSRDRRDQFTLIKKVALKNREWVHCIGFNEGMKINEPDSDFK